MERYFVMDAQGEARLEPDPEAWARWYEETNRAIARTFVTPEVAVLTTFRGVDESTESDETPRLFETRAFGGVLDGEEVLSATRTEALVGHAELARWCRLGNDREAGVSRQAIA